MNIYYDPEKFGLETVGEIEWSSGSYEFGLTVVWRRVFDDRFVYAEDTGCSCPTPFDETGVDELTVLPKRGGLASFKEHLEQRQASDRGWRGDGYSRASEIAELLERMHKAGAR